MSEPDKLINDVKMEVPKLTQCGKCGEKVASARIFRIPAHLSVQGRDRVCQSCYMNVTDNNHCGWHPNRLNKN
jgi:hypothetical protein